MAMMTRIVPACVLLCLAGLAMGQDAPKKIVPPKETKVMPVTPAADAPQITFEAEEHSWGVINDDKNVETNFKFTNTGKSTLEISNTAGSCGCTVPQLSKKTYAPGESGEIHVEYHPQGKRGPQQTNVTVTSNDPARPQVILHVKSDVRPMIMADPILVNLGQIPKGKGGTSVSKIVSRVPTLKPQTATPNNSFLEATIGPMTEATVEGETMSEYTLEIKVPPKAPVGQITANVAVRTNDPSRLLNITVMGEVVGDVGVNPPRLTLQSLTPDQEINTIFKVTSRTGKAFKVSEVVEEPAPGLPKTFSNITVTEDTSTTPHAYVVTVTGKAGDKAGAIRGDLVVKTDIEDEKEVKVPYYGFVKVMAQPRPRSVWDDNPSSLMPGPR